MAQIYGRNGHARSADEKVFTDLPALESLTVDEKSDEKATCILRVLRAVAKKNRTKGSRPFYSIRSVAKHFELPPTTVTRMYGRLKEEGLLTSAWGSKTFVEPIDIDRDRRVKGDIALPVALESFAHVRSYRQFFLAMRRELWRIGFAVRLMFNEGHDKDTEFLEERLRYKVDGVISFLPNGVARMASARLADRGVRITTIVDTLTSRADYHYRLSRERAAHECLAAWKKRGVNAVFVVPSSCADDLAKVATISVCLPLLGIKHLSLDLEHLQKERRLPQQNCGLIFTSSVPAVRLAYENHAHFRKLIARYPTLLIDGLIDFPAGRPVQGELDTLEFDWQHAARQIANDFAHPAGVNGKTHIFEANWICRRAADFGLAKG